MDRPSSADALPGWIGRSCPRAEDDALLQGQGRDLSDLLLTGDELQGTGHLAINPCSTACARSTRMTEGELIVSTASEEEWLDNILELNWQVYLCSIPPLLYQTATDRRIDEYTRLAMAGDARGARRVQGSLEPVRQALKSCRPPGTPQAFQKQWLEQLGQVGGPVRRPLLNLDEAQRAEVQAAFAASGLAAA